MNPAVEVSRRSGQRHGSLSTRPVMQLNSALGGAVPVARVDWLRTFRP
jgi:hypothetical protein